MTEEKNQEEKNPIDKNKEKFESLLKAAEQNPDDGHILYRIGCLMVDGCGCPKDARSGMEYWNRAFEKGYKYAAFYLGNGFENGYTGTPDLHNAVKWYTRGATDDIYAVYKLYKLYSNKNTPVYDMKIAEEWKDTMIQMNYKLFFWNLSSMVINSKTDVKYFTVDHNINLLATFLEPIILIPNPVVIIIAKYVYPDDSFHQCLKSHKLRILTMRDNLLQISRAIQYQRNGCVVEAFRCFNKVAESHDDLDSKHAKDYLKVWYPTEGKLMLDLMLQNTSNLGSAVGMHLYAASHRCTSLDQASLVLKSAKTGYTPARIELASWYTGNYEPDNRSEALSNLVPIDHKKGFEMMKVLADQTNDSILLTTIGYDYFDGELCKQDLRAAMEYWNRALNTYPFVTLCAYIYGYGCYKGYNGTINIQEAKKWLHFAVDKEVETVDAAQVLTEIYIEEGDTKTALLWYHKTLQFHREKDKKCGPICDFCKTFEEDVKSKGLMI